MPNNKNKYYISVLTTLYRKYITKCRCEYECECECESEKTPLDFANFVINHQSLTVSVKAYFLENKSIIEEELKLYYLAQLIKK